RVLHTLGELVVEGAERAVQQVPGQGDHLPVDACRFMDLALAPPAAAAAVEQSQLTVRVGIAMAQVAAEVLRAAGEPVPGGAGKAPGLLGRDGGGEFRTK